jgi:hypothetical protein
MKKFPKSVGLLCSATTIFALWGTVAHAVSPDQLDNLHDNAVTNLVANSPDNLLSNSIANPANNSLSLQPVNSEVPASINAPLEVSSALPELPSPETTSVVNNSVVNTSRVELPELASPQENPLVTTTIGVTTLVQTPVAPSLTALNPPSSPINLAEVSTSAVDIAPLPATGNSLLAQRSSDRISPFTPTAYIGVGVNLGLGSGNSDLSQGRFLVYGKLGFTQNISLRPAILLGNQTTFLIPVTYDFPLQAADAIQPVSFVPYLGGGVIIASGSGNNNIGLLLSGGVDFPISRDFTATAGLNVGFVRSTTDFGILLGIAYNIPGLRF